LYGHWDAAQQNDLDIEPLLLVKSLFARDPERTVAKRFARGTDEDPRPVLGRHWGEPSSEETKKSGETNGDHIAALP
jgi:hypothetical protein